jgi:predicted nucleic acid-binding protein
VARCEQTRGTGVFAYLEKNHPVWVPTKQNWLDSGELLGRMREDRGFTPEKLRDLHFDVLIALTARFHGARLITSNRVDFELIVSYKAARTLRLEIW